MSKLQEYLKHPVPMLLRMFNLNRVTATPVLPIAPSGDGRWQPGQTKEDPFQKPSDTIAESIHHRSDLNRVQRYAIYAELGRDPLNDEMMNAYAETITTINYDKGVVFWVTAENHEIEQQLTDMYGLVGAQEKAFAQVRAMLHFGDNFLGLEYTDRSKGIITLRHYEPWKVARIMDDLNRLTGYAPSDPAGNPIDIDKDAVPPFDILHQRLLSKDQDSEYGTGLFDTKWESWEDLQSMEDQIVLQRLLRRPDRLMILMDTTGMGLQESFEQIKLWETMLYKEININTGSRIFESRGMAMAENRDLIIPKGASNSTTIENFPASSNNDLLRDFDMVLSKYTGTMGFPKGYFGFEGGDYRSDVTLARQDPRFSKRAMRGQYAYLMSMTKLGMIHLALLGLDPLRRENKFEVHGMPISNFMEIEYNELLQMRFDLVDRMGRTAEDMGLQQQVWVRHVLRNVAKLPKDLVDLLLAKPQEESKQDPGKKKEAAAALEEHKELIEKVGVVEESLKACRIHSGPHPDISSESVLRIKDEERKEWDEKDFHGSAGVGSFRTEQMQRAKNRLDRLHAMASRMG